MIKKIIFSIVFIASIVLLSQNVLSANIDFDSNGVSNFSNSFEAYPIEYHSYSFNIQSLPNATSVSVNISFDSGNLDLFLLDSSGKLIAKSNNKNGLAERLSYNFLTDQTYEIRIYGNSTSDVSYNGTASLITLNSTPQLVDFGIINTTYENIQAITLVNGDNISLEDVRESKELYHIMEFSDNVSKNFSFFVPDSSIVSKIKVVLNWSETANYSLSLYDPSDQLKGISGYEHEYSGIVGIEKEEVVETNEISSGNWLLEINNNTLIDSSYTFQIYLYVDVNDWLSSNYIDYTNTTFSTIGENKTKDVQVNFSVPSTAMDGEYQGFLTYADEITQNKIQIPVSFKVRTPTLIVNNTVLSSSLQIDENSGFDLTKHFSFIVNNTGYYDMDLDITYSKLCSNSTCSDFANLTYDPILSVSNHSSEMLNVNVSFNDSVPNGVYEGWILLNSTNSDQNLTAHPYPTFNLTFKLNLTNDLEIAIVDSKSEDYSNESVDTSSPSWIEQTFNISLVNGTQLKDPNWANWLYIKNISVWVNHLNISSYHNNLTIKDLSENNGDYTIKLETPAGLPGGMYSVHINVTTDHGLNGVSSDYALVSENTGLYLLEYTSIPSSMQIGQTKTTKIDIINYGPLSTSDAEVSFIEDCDEISVSLSTQTININGYNTTGERHSWDVTANSEGTCTYKINITKGVSFGRAIEKTVTISSSDSGGTQDDSDSGNENTETKDGFSSMFAPSTTSSPKTYLEISSFPAATSIEQGSSKSGRIGVKNVHDLEFQDVAFSILDIDNSWYIIDAKEPIMIRPSEDHTFGIKFNIPENAETKSYTGTFKISSEFQTVTNTFTLTILPGAEIKTKVDQSLNEFEQEISYIESEINKTKQRGYNTTEIEALFEQLKQIFNRAKDSRDQGDYSSSYNLLNEINVSINQTKSYLGGGLPITGRISWLVWGNFGIVSLIGSLLGGCCYFFWPRSETSKTKKHYKGKRNKEEKMDKFDDLFEKLRFKIKKPKRTGRRVEENIKEPEKPKEEQKEVKASPKILFQEIKRSRGKKK